MARQITGQTIHIAPDGAKGSSLPSTGWKGIYGYNFEVSYENTRGETTPVDAGGFGRLSPTGSERATITFQVPWVFTSAGGTAGTQLAGTHADPYLDLFYAAGWTATLANTTTTYDCSDVDDAHTRIALVYSDGTRNLVMRRCLVSPTTVSVSATEEIMLTFEVQGVLEQWSTAAVGVTLPAKSRYIVPPGVSKGVTISVAPTETGTLAAVDELLGFDLSIGNTLEQVADLSEENGFREPIIAAREFTGSWKSPVLDSGDTLGRARQRDNSDAWVQVKFYSPWSTSTREISATLNLRPVAISEVSNDIEPVMAETASFQIQTSVSSASQRPSIILTDGRLTG